MKALVLETKGGPFILRDVPDPAVSDDSLLVKLKASALNHRDYYIKQGTYPRTSYPIIIGSDGAGVVEAVGANVSSSLPGTEVVINPSHNWGDNPAVQQKEFKVLGFPDSGTFAEYIVVPATLIQSKPKHLSFEEAAALPLCGLTAYRALFTRAGVRATDKVLITGIGGGVAVLTMQFALAIGAEVYITSGSDEKIGKAMALGAKGGTNYNSAMWAEELAKLAGGFDVIVDGAAGPGFGRLLNIASPGARIVNYGSVRGKIHDAEPARIFWKQLSILGTTMGTAEEFSSMLQFVGQHQLKPVIDQVFPLAEAEKAMERMSGGKQFGKIVLSHS